jgi:hypothetical protein
MAIRAGKGSCSANRIAAHEAQSQAVDHTAPRTDGVNSIQFEDRAAHRRLAWIIRDIARDEISRQVWIGQLENLRKRRAFVATGLPMALPQVTQQQEIEFLHATPATPLQAAPLHTFKFNADVQASSS